MGARPLAALAAEMEKVCRGKAPCDAASLLRRIEDEFARVREALAAGRERVGV